MKKRSSFRRRRGFNIVYLMRSEDNQKHHWDTRDKQVRDNGSEVLYAFHAHPEEE